MNDREGRLKGVLTLEAAVIFSLITAFVAGVINLDFILHDTMLSDVSVVLASQRYRQAKLFYCDDTKQGISVEAIVASPVIGEDEKRLANEKKIVIAKEEGFFGAGRLGRLVELTETDIEEVLSCNDNANIVRAGGRIVELIGGNDGD